MSGPAFSVVAGRIRSDLVDLERECEVIRVELARLDSIEDSIVRYSVLKGLALDLHALYTGVEHVFEVVARQLDAVAPTGERWHAELLEQMAAENPGVRPAAIRPATHRTLDELMRFRHMVRSAYTFEIDTGRVLALAGQVPALCAALAVDFHALADELERLSRTGN